MLLIFPPAAKPCEAPAGIAKLAGALKAHTIPCNIIDMNIEGLFYLVDNAKTGPDTWTRRAFNNRERNLSALKAAETYRSFDRYSRAVMDVNRVLEKAGEHVGITLSLADYHDGVLSPVRSGDLLKAAEHSEKNLFYPYFSKRLEETIEEAFSPRRPETRQERCENIIGFSLNYLSQALTTFAMIGFLKKEFPGAQIVLGGGLITSWMKRPGWRNPFRGLVDHLVAGPGEQALLSLCSVGEERQNHVTPEYELLPIENYLSPGFILPYSASSGCYWNKCSFCPESAEQNPYFPIPAQSAMHDLGKLMARRKPALVHLLDNAVSPSLMRSLAESPIDIPWYGFARIGRELLDFDYCVALKRAGCVMLKLGLESGDQGVLDKMQKGTDIETASLVLKNLQKAGIGTYVYLLFGTPHETITEARKTLAFVEAHRDAITFLNLAIFNMPVCGKESGEFERTEFYDGDLSLYTAFRHPQGWDRKQVRLFLDNEFKRSKAVAAILKDDPPLFTSNHAAFFL